MRAQLVCVRACMRRAGRQPAAMGWHAWDITLYLCTVTASALLSQKLSGCKLQLACPSCPKILVTASRNRVRALHQVPSAEHRGLRSERTRRRRLRHVPQKSDFYTATPQKHPDLWEERANRQPKRLLRYWSMLQLSGTAVE